jgi:ribosomal protein L7/L12
MKSNPSGMRNSLPAAALSALSEGDKIEAIKIIRKETGIGLTDAKALIERYLADPSSTFAPDLPASPADDRFPVAAATALYNGSKIKAIRIVREEKGIGLKDAKEIVELYLLDQPSVRNRLQGIQAEAGRRFFVWLIVIVALAIGGYYAATS